MRWPSAIKKLHVSTIIAEEGKHGQVEGCASIPPTSAELGKKRLTGEPIWIRNKVRAFFLLNQFDL